LRWREREKKREREREREREINKTATVGPFGLLGRIRKSLGTFFLLVQTNSD
jgi:hypothetical protein